MFEINNGHGKYKEARYVTILRHVKSIKKNSGLFLILSEDSTHLEGFFSPDKKMFHKVREVHRILILVKMFVNRKENLESNCFMQTLN